MTLGLKNFPLLPWDISDLHLEKYTSSHPTDVGLDLCDFGHGMWLDVTEAWPNTSFKNHWRFKRPAVLLFPSATKIHVSNRGFLFSLDLGEKTVHSTEKSNSWPGAINMQQEWEKDCCLRKSVRFLNCYCCRFKKKRKNWLTSAQITFEIFDIFKNNFFWKIFSACFIGCITKSLYHFSLSITLQLLIYFFAVLAFRLTHDLYI